MADIKNEYKKYLDDLEKNIKNKEDLDYLKNRSSVFVKSVLEYVDYILKYKENKIQEIEKIQAELEKKMNGLEKNIEEIKQDVYDEDIENEEIVDEEFDTEIICPYCESEILVDLSQEISEIQCPECNNIIELDWTGDIDNEEEQKENLGHCGGGCCSNCNRCKNEEEDDVL